MKWVIDDAVYSNGKKLFLGKWHVGGVHWNSCRSKDDPKKYVASCSLPGIKTTLDYYENEEEAKARVEKVVHYWVEKSRETDV
jgi:hypothetical protein